MPTLELLIDASGAQRGAQQAVTALDSVTNAASRTTRAVDSIYGSGSIIGSRTGGIGGGFGAGGGNASQVLTGGLQSATGIAQTAQALGQLNVQAAAFGAARTAFEIGNTIQDFSRFREGIGGATTAVGALGAAFKANPVGIIATAIGVAATAMSVFGSNTDSATDKINKQGDALRNLRQSLPELQQRAALGQEDPRGTDRGLIDAIIALRAGGATQLGSREAAGIFGVSESELRFGLQDFGINRNATVRDAPGVVRDGYGNIVQNPGGILQRYANQGPGGFTQRTFTSDELAQFGSQLLEERRGRRSLSQEQGEDDLTLARITLAQRDAEDQFARDQRDAARQAQEDAANRIKESMERAAQFGEQIGASVGDAAAQLLFAGSSLRSVVAGLVRQFATQGLQSAGAGIFGAITRGVAGATQTQNAANAGPPGGIGPPIS
jgi:hypothetical protein